jgi:hypothetical protein
VAAEDEPEPADQHRRPGQCDGGRDRPREPLWADHLNGLQVLADPMASKNASASASVAAPKPPETWVRRLEAIVAANFRSFRDRPG